MKNITSLLILIAATSFVGCSTTSATKTSSVVATVSCSDPRMRFIGTIVSDGHSKQVSGIGRGTFDITGQESTFSFKKTDANGKISLVVTKTGQDVCSATTDSQFGGVRGNVLIQHGIVEQQGASSF